MNNLCQGVVGDDGVCIRCVLDGDSDRIGRLDGASKDNRAYGAVECKSQRRPDCIRTGAKYVGIRPEGISTVRNRVAEYVGLPENDIRILPILSREGVVHQHAIVAAIRNKEPGAV